MMATVGRPDRLGIPDVQPIPTVVLRPGRAPGLGRALLTRMRQSEAIKQWRREQLERIHVDAWLEEVRT